MRHKQQQLDKLQLNLADKQLKESDQLIILLGIILILIVLSTIVVYSLCKTCSRNINQVQQEPYQAVNFQTLQSEQGRVVLPTHFLTEEKDIAIGIPVH